MNVAIIAAADQNRIIGHQNQLPFRLPTDLKRFKQLTSGNPVVMGRLTFESIGKPLSGRLNVVLSRNPEFNPGGALKASSLPFALGYLARHLEDQQNKKEIFIIGGAQVYAEALQFADRILLTDVDAEVDGDAKFPALDSRRFSLVNEGEWQQGQADEFRFRFLEFRPTRLAADPAAAGL